MPAIAIVQQLHTQMKYAVGFVLGRSGEWMWAIPMELVLLVSSPCPSLALHCHKKLGKKGLMQVTKIISQTEEVQGLCE